MAGARVVVSSSNDAQTLSARLNRLFDAYPHPTKDRPWRNSELVSECRARGMKISESHLSELRRGIKTNPSVRTLEAISSFFDVRLGYFTDAHIAAVIDAKLSEREAELAAEREARRQAQDAAEAAAREVWELLRKQSPRRLSSTVRIERIAAIRETTALLEKQHQRDRLTAADYDERRVALCVLKAVLLA